MARRFNIFGTLDDVIGARSEIADPANDGIEAQIGRGLCDSYASDPTAWEVGSVGIGLGGGPGVAFEGLCRPYWDSQGDYPAPEEPSPPFTGGQCDGVLYDVSINFCNNDGSPNDSTFSNRLGPITSFRITSVEDADDFVPNRKRYFWEYVDASGPQTGSTFSTCTISLSVVRSDGLPDDCGDPPPELPPPVAVPNPPTFGTPYDITDPVTGSPFPVTISPPSPDGSGDVYVDIDTPIGPITFSPGGGEPDAGPPSKPTSEGPPVNGGSDGDVDDEPETSEGALIGYSWEFPSVPANRGEIPLSNPKRFYPVIGGMQLKLERDDGTPYYGPQALIREQRGSILRPDPTVRVIGLTYTTDRLYNDVVIRTLRVRESL